MKDRHARARTTISPIVVGTKGEPVTRTDEPNKHPNPSTQRPPETTESAGKKTPGEGNTPVKRHRGEPAVTQCAVTLLVTETTGALSPTFDRALRALGKHARAPTTHDSTRYGLSRSSPPDLPCSPSRGYLSSAVVLADATTISLAAPAMSFKLTMGMSPF